MGGTGQHLVTKKVVVSGNARVHRCLYEFNPLFKLFVCLAFSMWSLCSVVRWFQASLLHLIVTLFHDIVRTFHESLSHERKRGCYSCAHFVLSAISQKKRALH